MRDVAGNWPEVIARCATDAGQEYRSTTVVGTVPAVARFDNIAALALRQIASTGLVFRNDNPLLRFGPA